MASLIPLFAPSLDSTAIEADLKVQLSWNGALNSRHQHRYYQTEPLLRCKVSLGEYSAFRIPVAFVVSWSTSVSNVSHGKGSYHQNGLNFLYPVQDCAFFLRGP